MADELASNGAFAAAADSDAPVPAPEPLTQDFLFPAPTPTPVFDFESGPTADPTPVPAPPANEVGEDDGEERRTCAVCNRTIRAFTGGERCESRPESCSRCCPHESCHLRSPFAAGA